SSGKFGTKAYKERVSSSCGASLVDSGKRYYNANGSQGVTTATLLLRPCYVKVSQGLRRTSISLEN
ncbi:MAG: hypothetical protein PHF69_06040, partial [Candidatus Omnitrophica bacterium]|nr:hypothetical protein [Candidatus Omnitrophota bacterium]